MESKDVMVGREDELEYLVSQMAKSFSGEGGLVLISGEAGSGKTTLCEAFEKLAVTSGCLVLVGRCVPASQSPYLPFIEAFFDQVLNPFAISSEPFSENAGRLLLSILESIELLAKDRTLVLWLEDLHWADSASISLVHFLARNVRTLNVLVIGTYRPEGIFTSSSGQLHPLKDAIRHMRREGVCHELELTPLKPSMTRLMVPLRLGGTVDPHLLELVVDESKGNPLYAVELLRYLVGSGKVISREGIWILQKNGRIQIPPTIREVVLARTEHIPKEMKQVLDCASVIGECFEPELIAGSLDIDEMRLLNELEELENEYQLVREDGGSYKFSHDLVRQVVYEQISTLRRKALHRSIGFSLEKKLPNDELFGPLSHHFNNANENGKCIKYSLSAGKYCSRQNALSEAINYFQLVLKRTDKDESFVLERLEALEGLGDLKVEAKTPREWYSFYEEFLELNQDRKARARVLAKAAECWDQLGLADINKANELLDEAESICDGDPKILANIEQRRFEMSSNERKDNDAIAHLDKARNYFEMTNDQLGILRCRMGEVLCLVGQGRMIEAKALTDWIFPLMRSIENPELLLDFELRTVMVCNWIGETELAQSHASEVIGLAKKLGRMWFWRYALILRAVVLEMESDYESAKKDLIEALDNAIEYEVPFFVAFSEIWLGQIELELGWIESAESHYEEALKTISVLDPGVSANLSWSLFILEAELLARKNAVDRSSEVYEEIIRSNEKLGRTNELVELYSRYGMSLARRDMMEKAQEQFEVALVVAKKIGCEKRVMIFAKRAGITLKLA